MCVSATRYERLVAENTSIYNYCLNFHHGYLHLISGTVIWSLLPGHFVHSHSFKYNFYSDEVLLIYSIESRQTKMIDVWFSFITKGKNEQSVFNESLFLWRYVLFLILLLAFPSIHICLWSCYVHAMCKYTNNVLLYVSFVYF